MKRTIIAITVTLCSIMAYAQSLEYATIGKKDDGYVSPSQYTQYALEQQYGFIVDIPDATNTSLHKRSTAIAVEEYGRVTLMGAQYIYGTKMIFTYSGKWLPAARPIEEVTQEFMFYALLFDLTNAAIENDTTFEYERDKWLREYEDLRASHGVILNQNQTEKLLDITAEDLEQGGMIK